MEKRGSSAAAICMSCSTLAASSWVSRVTSLHSTIPLEELLRALDVCAINWRESDKARSELDASGAEARQTFVRRDDRDSVVLSEHEQVFIASNE